MEGTLSKINKIKLFYESLNFNYLTYLADK